MKTGSEEPVPASDAADQAALSHIAVSNALLISGMFMPKPAFALALLPALGAGFSMTGAVSTARSHDPFSWERATEKNRST
ncbi:MAG: hypothetical protein ABW032_01560 [Burkholderiaceae bacterium]